MFFVFILILIAFVAGLVFFIMKRIKARNDSKEAEAAALAAKKIDPAMQYLIRLKDLNLIIRTEPNFDQSVLEKCEVIVDKLWKIIPGINNTNPAAELTWVVNKMAKEYLPELIGKFIELDPSQREVAVPDTLTALVAVETELDGINAIVQEQDMAKFKSQSRYLKDKFFKGDSN